MNWQEYWNNNKIIKIESDQDLLFQTEWTVNKKVINIDVFKGEVSNIKNKLDLKSGDILLDLCCGNGILTYELSKYVSSAIGVDFSRPFIENAIRHKSSSNTRYLLYDIKKIEDLLKTFEELPNKILMYGSLAYFKDTEVEQMLGVIERFSTSGLKFFIGSVLDKEKIWQFYNTPARKWDYFVKYRLLGIDIGLSRWWTKKKLEKLCNSMGLNCQFLDQNPSLHTSHYRFDVLITKINQY